MALAFRGGLFNIGAQGQAIMGAIVRRRWPASCCRLPIGLHLLVALLAGALGGALWGFMPGILKARTGAHEVITTIMLNYIAPLFLSWLILQDGDPGPGPLRRDQQGGRRLSAQLPRLLGRPSLRVDTSASSSRCSPRGASPGCSTGRRSASSCGRSAPTRTRPRTAGMSVATTYVLVMALAGALAGLGGAAVVLGTGRRADRRGGRQIGFDGILVALLGRVKPWGVVLAALLFGALQAGGNRMQSFSGISLELVTVLQALIVIFVAAPALVKAIFRLRASRARRLETGMAKGW